MSAMKNIIANATVTEDFPREFAIYDLNEFLAVISLFEKPELDFKDNFVIITGEGTKDKVTYWYSDPSVVTTPQKEISMPSKEVFLVIRCQMFNELHQLLVPQIWFLRMVI